MKRVGCNTVADILNYNGIELLQVRNLERKYGTEVITKMKELGFVGWASKVSGEIEEYDRQRTATNHI